MNQCATCTNGTGMKVLTETLLAFINTTLNFNVITGHKEKPKNSLTTHTKNKLLGAPMKIITGTYSKVMITIVEQDTIKPRLHLLIRINLNRIGIWISAVHTCNH